LYETPLFGEGAAYVYNPDFVRKLCGDISNEKDAGRVQDLVSLLQAVVKEDQEEIRIRMAFLAKKYANALRDSRAAD
jgi:hypothetical protein